MGKTVIRAKTAGFCMGVGLALRKLEDLLAERRERAVIYTLGPIIHNPQVLEAFAAQGVLTTENPEEIPAGATVVLRAHGVPIQVETGLLEKGVEIVDATCPKVKKAQLLIRRQARDGRTLLLYGEEDHPEVKGLLSYAFSGAVVFGDPAELASIRLDPARSYCVAAQTTQDNLIFENMTSHIRTTLGRDLPVLKTICEATRARQDEVLSLSADVDFTIVVGGFSSGNTRRLAKVVTEAGRPCLHVETASQIDPALLAGCSTVGLTAGASTPGRLIDQVQAFVENLP